MCSKTTQKDPNSSTSHNSCEQNDSKNVIKASRSSIWATASCVWPIIGKVENLKWGRSKTGNSRCKQSYYEKHCSSHTFIFGGTVQCGDVAWYTTVWSPQGWQWLLVLWETWEVRSQSFYEVKRWKVHISGAVGRRVRLHHERPLLQIRVSATTRSYFSK
jgi:hypothetical protein